MTDVRLIAETTLDLAVPEVTDLDEALKLRAVLRDAIAAQRAAADELDTAIGRLLGPDAQIVPGIGRVKRHPRVSRRNWDSDALKRDVLDSLIADSNGEVIEETPLQKIESVWPLKGYTATPGGILKRGLEVDSYCEVEWRGFTLEVR